MVGDATETVVMVDVDEIGVVVVRGSATDVVAAWSAEHEASTKSAIHRRIPLTVLSSST